MTDGDVRNKKIRRIDREIIIISIALIVIFAAAWIMILRLEPGFLLPSHATDNPGEFARGLAILAILAFAMIVLCWWHRLVSMELKKEREDIENKHKRS